MLEQRFSENDVSVASGRRDIPSFIEPRPPLIQNPFMRPRPQKGTNLMELFEDSEIEEPELVQVYLRLKPCKVPNTLYEIRSDKCLVTSLDTATAGHGRRTQHNVSKMYTFSKIFGAECNQKEIFEHVVKDNLKKLPEGHSFTLLTYGASGSGKTYTLMGTVGSPGLVPRSLEYVFRLVDAAQQPAYKPAENGAEKLNYPQQDFELQWVKRLRHISAPLRDKYRRMSAQLHTDLTTSSIDLSNRIKYYVWVSFVEIYNEAIYDLLAPPEKRTKLRIREDSSGNVYVKGATQAFVRSGEEAYDVMVAGKHNLVVAATGVHAHSSRSHCIFTITMLTETGDGGGGGVRASCVRLCDLAGCERARATGNRGARMQESRAINSSLHVLERCLHMLRRNQRSRNDALVPYRESKLTRLLGTGLSGARGEAVSMVVTLNPSPEYAYETKHVLGLAAVAQDIQINNTMLVSTLESSTQDTTISCSSEVIKLRSDNERLHFELVQAQARNKELLASMEERQQEAANTMRELVEEAKDMTRQYYEAQLEALRSEMDDMVEEYESRLSKQQKEHSSTGTPSRYLQTKVSQLMTAIAVLEEQLTVERLARSRAEKEVEHLRSCIEERDEKAFKDATPPQDVVLSDSENESDEDVDDPFNESLEPIFKKEHNKSVANRNESTSIHTIDNIEEEDDEVDADNDKPRDTIRGNDSKNTTIVDDNENDINEKDVTLNDLIRNDTSVEEKNTFESSGIDSANATYENSDIIKNDVVDKNDDSVINDIVDTRDKDHYVSINNKLKQDYVNDSCNDVKNENSSEVKSSFICRGTYFVSDNKMDTDDGNDDSKEKSSSSIRGTYFVKGPAADITQNIESTDKDITMEVFKEPVITKQKTIVKEIAPQPLVNKIMRSFKSSEGRDCSLRQFEQLEMAAKVCEDEIAQNQLAFGDIKMLKEKRTYFDNEPTKDTKVTSDEVKPVNKEKRIYFDNIDVNIDVSNKKLNEIINIDEERSPSIVKDNIVCDDFEPSKIKRLLGESFTKPEITSSIQKARLAKKHESVDLFESPVVKMDNIEKARQSIERMVLDQKSARKVDRCNAELSSPLKKDFVKSPAKKDTDRTVTKKDTVRFQSPVKENIEPMTIKSTVKSSTVKELIISPVKKIILKSPAKTIADFINSPVKTAIPKSPPKKLTVLWPLKKETEESKHHKADVKKELKLEPMSSVEEEKIIIKKEAKLEPTSSLDEPNQTSELSNLTARDNTIEEFENIYKDITAPRATEFELLVSQSVNETIDKKDKDEQLIETDNKKDKDETKYNLRKKHSKTDDGKTDKSKADVSDEILLESQAKCESKGRKRTLRLRRKKNQSEGENDDKLKDIVNLQTEFSDVTMDVPALQKVVKDIPSPEKGAEENLPPMGIQSCPAKSITRSRRKLFTPRAEPLEESLTQTGDSNERIYVPRPSYHRPRARRKL